MQKSPISFLFRILIGLSLTTNFAYAQGVGVPLGSPTYHIMDRLEIKTGMATPFHSGLKYYSRGEVVKFALDVDTSYQQLTDGDQWDLSYIFKDNNEWLVPNDPTTLTGTQQYVYKKKFVDSTQTFYTMEEVPTVASRMSERYFTTEKPFLKYFYKTPANFFELNKPSFTLKVNPILNLKMGLARDDDEPVFHNQRGVEVRGAIDDRVYFYSNILETQSRFANYVTDRIQKDRAVPGQGLYKTYNSTIFDITNGFDYLNAQGYIGFNVTKHIGLQFGHGRNFIGNGYRSLILSDFANNYLYLKLNTKFWKIHYQNIFGELATQSSFDTRGDVLDPKKYFAAHHLSIDITPNLNIGLFEAIVFSRNNNFELQYLNPIILYRTVEQFIGSPDNALIGLDGKWNLFKRFQLYSQLMLDEFKLDELIVERNGWWANKYGIQVGLKYIDVLGIDHLDAQVEYNVVRPFTYTHRDSSASYSHYNQPLAHPLGANFKETVFRLRYQPVPKLIVEGRIISAKAGEDTPTENWGSNILTPHATRFQDYGNETTQGVTANILLAGLDVSYQLFHNAYLDLHFFYRKKDSEDNALDLNTTYIGGGFRMNITSPNLDF